MADKTVYRRDIDGLRALAILPVVWFHSGLPGAPGGFVGVDVFFVISGYLITRIVRGDIEAGSFSFGHFYRRRFRRIAPALAVVLITTLAAGYLLLMPDDLMQLCRSAIATVLMVPNVHFWSVGGGDYFAAAKHMPPPLLHTWSLGIEEQFYLVFPLFLLIATRIRAARPAILAVAILSFLLCVAGSTRAPISTFYLLPGRAWELALGALLAMDAVAIPARWRGAMAAAGIVMIAASVALLRSEGASPLWTVAVPATGAMLLIGSGPDTPVSRVLGWAPFVWIGRISYSLYLWHWPLFAFLQRWWIDDRLPASWSLAGIAVSVALASITYRWIEQPARRDTARFGRVAVGVATSAAAILVAAAIALTSAGLPNRLTPRARAMLAQADDQSPLALNCFDVPFGDVERRCTIGRGAPSVAVWGDSHAAADSAAVALASGRPTVLLASLGCSPTIAPVSGVSDKCVERNRAVLAWLNRNPRITTVVLIALWSTYERPEPDGFWRGIEQTSAALAGRRVIVVTGIPAPGVDVPTTSATREQWGRAPFRLTCPAARVLRGTVQADLSAAFCAYPEPWRLFVDRHHPSMTANREVIAPALRPFLATGG